MTSVCGVECAWNIPDFNVDRAACLTPPHTSCIRIVCAGEKLLYIDSVNVTVRGPSYWLIHARNNRECYTLPSRIDYTAMASTRFARLLSLQSKQLKLLAMLTGRSGASTKSSIAENLDRGICAVDGVSVRQRILSIDMGIKNLAYCVLEPDMNTKDISTYKIIDWKRLNLLAPTVPTTAIDVSQNDPEVPDSDTEADLDTADTSSISLNQGTKNLFTPSKIAPLAFQLSQTLLRYNPTTIVIERQRFRSGGGSAVQEWTLRVNMLEAMLWACFATTKSLPGQQKRDVDFDVKEMNPSRIAAFWLAQPYMSGGVDAVVKGDGLSETTGTEARTTSSVMDKKVKIRLVSSWIEEGVIVGSEEVSNVIDGFRNPSESTLPGRRKGDSLGKKDDLADCLVQGVTAARWHRNTLALRDILDKAVDASDAKPKSAGRAKKAKS